MIYDVKTYRIANSLTQQDITDLLGLKKSTVSMIESGKRELPKHAWNKLCQLQRQAGDANNPVPAVSAEPFFKTFKAEHDHAAAQYIRIYIGDLQSEKHRLEKLIKSWTFKFNEAGKVLKEAEIVLTAVEKQAINYAVAMPELLARKRIAEEQLRDVTRQKPEIALIRLEGIKKELATAKALLGKRQRFPVLDTVSLIYAYVDAPKQISIGENKGQLQDGEKE